MLKGWESALTALMAVAGRMEPTRTTGLSKINEVALVLYRAKRAFLA